MAAVVVSRRDGVNPRRLGIATAHQPVTAVTPGQAAVF